MPRGVGRSLEAQHGRRETFLPGNHPGCRRDPPRTTRKSDGRLVAVCESIGETRSSATRTHGPRTRRVARGAEGFLRGCLGRRDDSASTENQALLALTPLSPVTSPGAVAPPFP